MAWNDTEIAERIASAVSALNDALYEAAHASMNVDLEMIDGTAVNSHPIKQIKVRLWRRVNIPE